MRRLGAFPVGAFADDLTVERELLEAPSDEPTLPGGLEILPPHYYDVALSALSLAEQLDSWHADTWGGDA